jgi:hypothetical protein
LRIAYPFSDGRPVIVAFSCVNGGQPDHGTPTDEQLLALLPPSIWPGSS